MGSLKEIVEDKQTELFRELGVFFAFNDKQINEGLDDLGVVTSDVVSVGGGMIVLKKNADELVKRLRQIHFEGIKQDIAENGIDNIIAREMANYETHISLNGYDDVKTQLADYDVSEEQLKKGWQKHCATAEY